MLVRSMRDHTWLCLSRILCASTLCLKLLGPDAKHIMLASTLAMRFFNGALAFLHGTRKDQSE